MVCCLPGSRVTTRLRLRSSRSIDKATSCRRPKALRSLMEVSQTYRVEQKEKKATERLCIPPFYSTLNYVPIYFLHLSSGPTRIYASPCFARIVYMYEVSQRPNIIFSFCSHSYSPKPLADVEIACRERERLEEYCRFN